MEHLWSLSNMTRVHVDSGLPYSSLLTFAQHHHTFILQGNYNQWSISLVTAKCNRMSIIFNDIWKYFPSVCVAINHPKLGIVGIFRMGRYQKLAIPNIVKWTKIFQTIPWKESSLQNK